MNNFYISINPVLEQTAWYKAITDVEYFLDLMGFKPIPIISCNNNLESSLSDIIIPSEYQKNENDIGMILLQYPRILFEGLDLAKFTDYIKTNYKNYKLVALVHDLDSIRFGNYFNDHILTELPMLNQFDYLITPNESMSALLKKCGAVSKIYPVPLFDYVITNEIDIQKTDDRNRMTISYAGNLKYEKASFIYKLYAIELKNIQINLYGPWLNQDKFKPTENIHYKGSFQPGDLPYEIKDAYGLCWEGDSLESCSGKMGEYFQYSNPHKTSFYLAMGIPIIISKDISTASFVQEMQVGLTIDSLYEIPELLNSISDEKYNELKENALRLSDKLRNGFYIKKAVNEIKKDILSDLTKTDSN